MNSQQPSTPENSLRAFFFAEETPYGLAIVRMLLPLILLCVVIPRWSHSRELFSTDGATAPLAANYGLFNFPPEPSGAVAVMMMSALAFCLIAVSIGWHPRFALITSWLLYTYLNMLDCLSTLTKYSVISSHVLFLLSLSSCGAVWSIDAWRSHRQGDAPPMAAAWPRRLVQLLIGFIYFGAAFTKMHTDGFMSGDQIRFWLITNMNNANPLGEQLALYPELIVAMSHIAVIWQIVFVFLSWRGMPRLAVLGMGTMFHLSTVWLLGLYIFPPVMIITYFAWLNERDVHQLRSHWQRLLARLNMSFMERLWARRHTTLLRLRGLVPLPSAIVLFLGLSATVFAGLRLEHHLDPYQQRLATGPLPLQTLADEVVHEMLHSDVGIRESDKFFGLEIGTETLGGVVVHRRTVYSPGERVIVQCALIPPHEDLWIDCSLQDEKDNEVQRFGRPFSREMLRADFVFTLPADAAAGRYRFIVHSGTQPVLTRSIVVKAP